jgi:aconitase A
MREHCRERSRNFPGRNGPGRKTTGRAGPALVVARTGRAGPGPEDDGPGRKISARSQL